MGPNTELAEIRTLILQTENLVSQLESLIPTAHSWMEWRRRKIEKRLELAKIELKKLVDLVQVKMLEEHYATRIGQEVVEPKINAR